MASIPPTALDARLVRLRERLEAEHLDALLVSNLTNIRYLTGFHGSAGALAVFRSSASLVVDFRYRTAAREATANLQGTSTVVAPLNIDETIVEIQRTSAASRVGFEAQWMSVARFGRLSAALQHPSAGSDGAPSLEPTERIVEQERSVKDAVEIGILREAGAMLAGVAARAPALARPGRSEREVAESIDVLIHSAGFERPAVETIVASGRNAALPHARPTARLLQPGEGVVLDFGGVYSGYCVDLTRTVQLGTPGPEWGRILGAVAAAQAAAIEAVRPGIPASEVDHAARQILEDRGLGEAFGHATGHGLGLDVHEEPRIGRYTAGHPDVVLRPGMVFTVEPGAYLEGFGGARIEDDVLVTGSGCEILTRR
jgi:Xaa-Pro aminopeptidase